MVLAGIDAADSAEMKALDRIFTVTPVILLGGAASADDWKWGKLWIRQAIRGMAMAVKPKRDTAGFSNAHELGEIAQAVGPAFASAVRQADRVVGHQNT